MAVAIDDGGFRPHEIDVGPGETVTIEVRNDDSTEHDFAIPALDLNTGVIEPGRLATARFEAPATATDFVCTLHPSMKGALVPRGWMPNLRSPRSAIGIEPKKGRDLDARIETRREEVAGRQS